MMGQGHMRVLCVTGPPRGARSPSGRYLEADKPSGFNFTPNELLRAAKPTWTGGSSRPK